MAALTCQAAMAALPEGVKEIADIAYVPNADPARKLDLYLPEKRSDTPLPVIVWIHGGGWVEGAKADCRSVDFVPLGYAAASIEYRFSRVAHFPAQIQDCQAAIRWLRAHSKEYNLNADHIGVWGESAGGHLVALLGTSGGQNAFPKIGGNDDQSDRVQAVCDFYGPTDFNTVMRQAAADPNVRNVFHFNQGDPYSLLIGVPLATDSAAGDAVSPVHYVSGKTPPFLIMHGMKDTLVPFAQTEELAAALRRAKVDVLLQRFPNAGHSGPLYFQPAVREVVRMFFDKYLKNRDVTVKLLPEDKLEPTAVPNKP